MQFTAQLQILVDTRGITGPLELIYTTKFKMRYE